MPAKKAAPKPRRARRRQAGPRQRKQPRASQSRRQSRKPAMPAAQGRPRRAAPAAPRSARRQGRQSRAPAPSRRRNSSGAPAAPRLRSRQPHRASAPVGCRDDDPARPASRITCCSARATSALHRPRASSTWARSSWSTSAHPQQLEARPDGGGRPHDVAHEGRGGQPARPERPRHAGVGVRLELRTRDRERKLIRKIEEALSRIEDGSYGYCLETGEPIGVKRLEARPVATLCIEAQERRERREKQYGDRDDWYR